MNKAITIGTAIMMSLSLAACGSSKNNTSSNNATSSKKVAPKYHKVGDTVKVGKVTYTLKSVEVTNERNEFEDNQPKYVIKVVYHVKNNSDKELPIGADLDAYGPDNNKLKSYPIDNTTLDSIAAGKEADVTTGFGADKLGTFELQFSPLVSTEKPVKFRVKVKSSSESQQSGSSSQQETSQSQQQISQNQPQSNQNQSQVAQSKVNASSSSSDVNIAGHSFHHEDFYGTDILVGNNGEGEAGEWAANDPSVQGNPDVGSQIGAIYNNH
ncbi:DUF4352 domain-containing protein [Limosilactobacillus reuteri]|uniref:DUF4352 domain-containing protein n=1 Tax=Limosilactobacillus reuteri TaxID=1598 RepID=UPI0021D1C564|nr:DUF4352 domain-containing protein [Limosilactobacillus reuteri]MCU4690978.1 DUF4352 domain-containing protein [Limosilactobacillus reuteri]